MNNLRKKIGMLLVFLGIFMLSINCMAAETEEEPFELIDLWRENTPKLVLNGFYAGDDGNYYNEDETVKITLTESTNQADQFLIMGDKSYSIMGLKTGMSEDEVSALLTDEMLYADVMYMGYRVQLYYIEYNSIDYEIVVYYFGDYATLIGFYNLNEDDLLTLGNCEAYDETSWYAQTYSATIQYESGEEENASECYIAYTTDGYFGFYIVNSFTEVLWTDCTEDYVDGALAIYHSSDSYAIIDDKECIIECYDEDGTYYRFEANGDDEKDEADTKQTETVIILGSEEETESSSSAASSSGDGFVENWYEVYPQFHGAIGTSESEYIWFMEMGNTLRVFFDEGDVCFDVLLDEYVYETTGYAAGGYRYDAMYAMGYSLLYYPDTEGGYITIEVDGSDEELWYKAG